MSLSLNPNDELNPEDDLRMDNQIKRLELEMKGAKFIEHNPEGIELPAEIEAQMLDQILQFEKMKHLAKEIEIYEFLGKPKLKLISDIQPEDMAKQKNRLINLLAKKGIILGSMAEVEDKEMYRFISEEFLFKKMLDMPVKGFIRHYIYEEYYPNEKLNVEKTVQFFLEAYLMKDDEVPTSFFCHQDLTTYLDDFSKLYERFTIKKIEVEDIKLKKTVASAILNIEFEAFIEHSRKSHYYEGSIPLKLKKNKQIWQILDLKFPKL